VSKDDNEFLGEPSCLSSVGGYGMMLDYLNNYYIGPIVNGVAKGEGVA